MRGRPTKTKLDTIQAALEDLKRGRPVIVVDDESRENEGDLVLPATFVSGEWINFMTKNARGLICVAMTGAALDRLGVPMMVPHARNGSKFTSPFTLSVEAARGVTTGISAGDRAETIRTLTDPASTAADIKTPGHVFPLRAHPEGLRARRGHTEAAVALCRVVGLPPAGVICEIMNEDGTMARLPQLAVYAREHGFRLISIEQIVAAMGGELLERNGHARLQTAPPVVNRDAVAALPTRFGLFTVTAYRDATGLEHLLMQHGDTTRGAPLVRVHSECLTGDVLGSVRCDCGEQLDAALERIAGDASGALVYLRQEGRGIGLANKIRAYALQDDGLDTVEANLCLGFRPDERDYAVAAGIIADAGIRDVRLLTNNPDKIRGLEENGIRVVERIPLEIEPRPENARYLRTKRSRLKHLLGAEEVR